jgi:hypothetical protein
VPGNFNKPINVKRYVILLLACYPCMVSAQSSPSSEHIFIITTDGFRWQEIFSGADSALINDDHYVRDPSLLKQMFWDSTAEARRKKLMPFFWNVIAREGQLYGNRTWQNKVNMSNRYWISYPGYNEILTGYADPILIPNLRMRNRNENVLEFLNRLPQYKGKVVAFTSWSVFPFILNEKRSHVLVNSGYKMMDNPSDSTDEVIDDVQKTVSRKSHTRYDLLTFSAAEEYVRSQHPAVLFLGFGETDEAAHAGRYDLYLQKAAEVDRMISELWYYVQTDPEYKGHTTFIITTDHGRGEKSNSWHTHIKQEGQLYAKQLAATIGQVMGANFETTRPAAKAISWQ